MKPTLLILAAGMGSRYGGLKQLDAVGPNGETIIDYSIFDAVRAGFGRLVFVIRRDIESAFKQTVGARFEKQVRVEYVYQELDKLPPGFLVPAKRKKPWGTGHAVLMAADAIQEPFGVINADDFYGGNSFRVLGEYLQSGSRHYAMTAFLLRNTLSEHGSVSRGVCREDTDVFLQNVTELTGLEKDGAGARYRDELGTVRRLNGNELVSMNLWGFTPTLFDHLRDQFVKFLQECGTEEKAEYYIPAAVNTLIATGRERCRLLRTPDSWLGVTYREDRPAVIEGIRYLIARGDYPKRLWI
ncbi:MAG: nucleotidyltransferase family protein [Limisphaerales bacterium]